MNGNTGTVDRAIRAVIGVALIAATLGGVIGIWGWLGVILLLTAVVGWCPLYSALGINTCGLGK